jgi:hypothetical protein
MNLESSPPRDSAQVACPCCWSAYRYATKDMRRGIPMPNEKCRSNRERPKANGALLVAASIVAAILVLAEVERQR